MKCPHCGQTIPFVQPSQEEDALLTLRYMAREGRPLFWGCLDPENLDPELEEMKRSGWIKRTPQGFVVTPRGRAVLRVKESR